jgi:hypothetical protein
MRGGIAAARRIADDLLCLFGRKPGERILIMNIGDKIWIPGDDFYYEVIHANEKRASIETHRQGSNELFWIVEDDLPLGTVVTK